MRCGWCKNLVGNDFEHIKKCRATDGQYGLREVVEGLKYMAGMAEPVETNQAVLLVTMEYPTSENLIDVFCAVERSLRRAGAINVVIEVDD